jgi:hypothetical protein
VIRTAYEDHFISWVANDRKSVVAGNTNVQKERAQGEKERAQGEMVSVCCLGAYALPLD